MTTGVEDIRISHIEEHSDLLGPFDRFLIWVHGCCFDCDDCLAEDTRFGSYSTMSPADLAKMVANSGAEGVTISGGEPFLQAEPLAACVRKARALRDIGCIIYSGFTIEELREREGALDLLNEADILIDGRYVKELDDGRAYIGSSNQRLHILSDRYKEIAAVYYSSTARRAEIKLNRDNIALVGVPTHETLDLWRKIKRRQSGERSS